MGYKNKQEKFEILNIFKVVYAHGISLSNPLSNPTILNIWGDIAPDILPPGGHFTTSEDILGCYSSGDWWGVGWGGGVCYWHLVSIGQECC